jgi:hypothetical protein
MYTPTNAQPAWCSKQLVTSNIGPCDGVFHHQRRDDAAPRRPEKDLAPHRRAGVATLMSRYCACCATAATALTTATNGRHRLRCRTRHGRRRLGDPPRCGRRTRPGAAAAAGSARLRCNRQAQPLRAEAHPGGYSSSVCGDVRAHGCACDGAAQHALNPRVCLRDGGQLGLWECLARAQCEPVQGQWS